MRNRARDGELGVESLHRLKRQRRNIQSRARNRRCEAALGPSMMRRIGRFIVQIEHKCHGSLRRTHDNADAMPITVRHIAAGHDQPNQQRAQQQRPNKRMAREAMAESLNHANAVNDSAA